jgi:hypothetical protein
MQEFGANTLWGLLVCLPGQSPRESSPPSLGDDTREED